MQKKHGTGGLTMRENCPMRHENGNCLPAGGFCTAVNDSICEALHNAYHQGKKDAAVLAARARTDWKRVKDNGKT